MSKIATTMVMAMLCLSSLYATNVPATISSNMTLDTAGSPWIVISSVTVIAGVTLTVDPGVEVQFNSSRSLTVDGILNATNATFTAGNGSTTPGYWNYITISGTANFTNCIIEYADYIAVTGSGSVVFDATAISDYDQFGIYIQTPGGSVTMQNACSISTSEPSTSGIYNIGGVATLNGTTISGALYGIRMSADAEMDLSNCSINNNFYAIYYTGVNHITHANTILTGNTLQATYIAGAITVANDTFKLHPFDYPYYFAQGINIDTSGRMEVASGNIVKLSSNYRIDVSGSLFAEANPGETIIFTSFRDDNAGGDSNADGQASAPGVGDWQGILFDYDSDDNQNVLRRCIVRYTYYSYGAVRTIGSNPVLDSCAFSNNYYGVQCTEGANPVISNCDFATSALTPIAIDFSSNPVFTNNTFSFSDNAYDAIGLLGGTMTTSSTIPKRSVTGVSNITYVMLSSIIIPDTVELTIEPGVVIKPISTSYSIRVLGKLIADGTMAEPIVFTSIKDDNYGQPSDTNKDGSATAPTPGNWRGIVFDNDSDPASILDYCIVQYGSTSWSYASGYSTLPSNVAVIKSNPSITNCTFTNSTYGVTCYNTAAPLIENGNFINCSETPIAVTANADPTITNVSFTNAGRSALGLIGNRVSANGTIRQKTMGGYANIVYLLIGTMYIDPGTYIDIEPGIVIKCKSSASIRVEGGLQVVGTSTDPIIFTSEKDDNIGNPLDTNGDGNSTTPNYNSWSGIRYYDTSDDSYTLWNHFEYRYGGSQLKGLSFENANGTIKNGRIFNAQIGLLFYGTSATVVDSVLIENCQSDPIGMSLTANPTFTNIEFNSNASNGLFILDDILSGNTTLIQRDVAGFSNIAYIIDKLTISSSVTLTVNSGVVIKFRKPNGPPYIGNLTVEGALIADGTLSENIVFTSYEDDSSGGDTNNDGNATAPTSNWRDIRITSTSMSGVNSLKYCDIRYMNGGVVFDNSGGTVELTTLQQISGAAIEIIGSGNPDISDCQFINVSDVAIEMSMFSTPSFSNNLMSNVEYSAIRIRQETWSQTDTIPLRSFAGYDSITYLFPYSAITISPGTTITIPAGVTIKQDRQINYPPFFGTPSGFTVEGELIIDGTSSNPVAFTNIADDNYGNPKDTEQNGNLTSEFNTNGTWLVFKSGSNDNSSISNLLMKSFHWGFKLESASPTINESTLQNGTIGIVIEGSSAPTVTNNQFDDLSQVPIHTSILTYPALTSGNTMSGTTIKAIGIKSETLSQDFTLSKRAFAGINAIPYLFSSFIVGTGAILTIEPGIICKFGQSGQLVIKKGLQALGGQGNQSIVFTSQYDDFYGGDTNSDSTLSQVSANRWVGITFENEAIDNLCKIDNCVIRGATYLRCVSSSPTITNTSFSLSTYGIYATAASNPIVDSCDFSKTTTYAIQNVSQAFTISAENCWWGDCTGPTHTGNPDGQGEVVSDGVDYNPFFCGPKNPIMGDVSLNNEIQAYDASLILQYVGSLIALDTLQKEVADVSGQMGITALDASLVLQYLVGLIEAFPAESTERNIGVLPVSDVRLDLGEQEAQPGDTVSVAVTLSNVQNMLANDMLVQYDPSNLQYLGFEKSTYARDMQDLVVYDELGFVQLIFADYKYKQRDGILGYLRFAVSDFVAPHTQLDLNIMSYIANERDLTTVALDGHILIGGTTATTKPFQTGGGFSAYPNPFSSQLTIHGVLSASTDIQIQLFDVMGKMHLSESYKSVKGEFSARLNTKNLPSGTYALRLSTGKDVYTSLVQHIR